MVEVSRYSLSVPLQEVDSPWTGGADDWPLHITLVPDFLPPHQLDEAGLSQMCLVLAQTQKPFYVNFGEQRDGFGEKPAQEVVGSNRTKLLTLHAAALDRLKQAGCELVDSNWVGRDYNPHCSSEKPVVLKLRIVVNSLMLVRKVGSGSETIKEVVDVWRLGKDGEQARIIRNV